MARHRKTVTKDGITHSYRKAIKISETIYISLPKGYCLEHGVKEGDVFALTANSIISMVKKA